MNWQRKSVKRKNIFNFKIHWLLSGLVFFFGLLLLLIYNRIEINQFQAGMHSQYVRNFESRLLNILKLADGATTGRDKINLDKILALLRLEKEVEFIALYDKRHHIILASDSQYNKAPLSKIAPAELAHLFNTHFQMNKSAVDRHLLETVIHCPRLEYDFKAYGVFIRADLSDRMKQFRQFQTMRLYFTAFLVALLAVLVFILLRAYVSRPLTELASGKSQRKARGCFEVKQLISYLDKVRNDDKEELKKKIDSENRLRRLVLKLEQEISKRNIRLTSIEGKIKKDVEQRFKLEEQSRKMSRILEYSPTSIVITDLNGQIEYVNPRFSEVTGYSFEEAIGQNPRILKSGDMDKQGYKKLWDTISAGEIWRGLFHNKKKNGELYWEFAHIAPVKNDKGEVTHYIAIKEDITKQKEAEETNLMFAEALQSIGEMVSITDLDNRFIYVNESFLRTYQYDKDEIIGRRASILFNEESTHTKPGEVVEKTLNGGWSGELFNKSKTGRVFPVFLTTSLIKNEKNQPIALVGISRDISMEKRRVELEKKIEMQHTVQELAGAVSHEFSQPLQALENYIGLMSMGQSKKNYLADMGKAVKRIAELVKNLREITVLEKKEYLNTQILDLKASSQITVNEKPHVLVVDDEQTIKETLTEMISLAGYNCDGANDGMEALRLVSENKYQLIISDVNMPRMSGTALFDKLKGVGYKGAFVFMTGYDMSKDTEEIIRKGDGLLHKPVNSETLIKIIETVFQSKK